MGQLSFSYFSISGKSSLLFMKTKLVSTGLMIWVDPSRLILLFITSLMMYKRTKQRQEVDYGQQLRQQRVEGSINPYKLGFISISMVVVLTFLLLHQFSIETNIQVICVNKIDVYFSKETRTYLN